jgi:acetyltransferase
MVQYRRNQELLYETPEALPEDWAPDHAVVRQVLAEVRAAGRTLLTEAEAKRVLTAYDIPVAPTVPAVTPDEAIAAARRIGYPVVLKLLSRTLTHKSDVGGVQLDLPDDTAVGTGFETIRANLAKRGLEGSFEGVTVQPMIRDRGHELIVGSSVDAQFGPVLLFGAGGVLVEVLKDRALGLPPLNRTLARRLMERTAIFEVLKGMRGQTAVAFGRLETLLVRFSQLVVDYLEIQEIDMNPLLATADGVVALDARMVLAPPDLPAEGRPRLAIQPYPNQYVTPWKLDDGSAVTIRPIRPEDEPLIVKLHKGHSEHTIRMRFFSLVKTLSRDSLIRLCHLDYEREMALVAVRRDGGQPYALGVSRYYLNPETGAAEFAVVVGDAWQGHGLGYCLMQRLIDVARQRGVRQLVGSVLRENTTMLKLVEELGFQAGPSDMGDGVVDVVLNLGDSSGKA